MSARVVWQGLQEFRAELRRLPTELTGEASGIVMGAATDARNDIAAAYPRRTGNLANGLKVTTKSTGPFGTAVIVKNSAQHAHLFEYGTQARHTDIGANRGSMPPGNVFIPRIVQHRLAMFERLKAMMVRHGLTVKGSA